MTDTELKHSGLRLLSEKLGLVEAERFVTLILREPFDYTKWRQDIFEDITLEELHTRATQAENPKDAAPNP